ncbi:MAG: flagellar basal body rod protein FlgC [Planctomycetota bacterium]|jgi:flagellar basal-body rod protein FlgC
MFGALDISASALVAQRTRLNTISANMANMNSTHDAFGNYNPYRRRIPVFAAGDPATGSSRGVHVREIMLDPAPFKQKYMPEHPDADAKGYVKFPNIDGTTEQINAMEASRAYEANITAAEATKQMMSAAMRLLA